MELQAILDAFKADPTLESKVLNHVAKTDAGKTLIDARADVIYKEKIGDEVAKIHSQYDDDIFAIIGKRPGTKDGQKQKTYDFLKEELTSYKKLLDIETSLNADAKVIELNKKLEELTKQGGGTFMKEQWDAAAAIWKKEKEELEGKVTTLETTQSTGLISLEIAKAKAGLKMNPDVDESLREMAMNTIEANLIKNSKIEEGKVVFLNAEGKPILNATQTGPATAAEVLAEMKEIKTITLTGDNSKGGGGADPIIVNKVETKNVEGKNVKTVNLGAKGTFKDKVSFNTAFEKAMQDSGIAKGDPDYDQIEKSAYAEHEVGTLPAQV